MKRKTGKPKDKSSKTTKTSLIPIILKDKIVATVPFEPNLNMMSKPSYVNESCNMGLSRLEEGKFKNKLVVLYENEFYPTSNHGEFISENDAYELCVNRGKYEIIKKYDIKPEY